MSLVQSPVRTGRFVVTVCIAGCLATGLALGTVNAKDAVEESTEGYVALCNGKDLTGWVGDTKGYAADEGGIVCLKGKGGNLYTAKEYGDFILRFQFKLEAGGNNGVGIRCEKGKNAAYYGMEIQVLDDTAPVYAKLKPYQYHGSIYGVAPAIRGHLKPVGEWNNQEIHAEGNHIKITLNGKVIVDVDLEEVGKPNTIDGGKHPGLFNKKGHIAFCGHGHKVVFRKLYIKELGE